MRTGPYVVLSDVFLVLADSEIEGEAEDQK